MLAISVYEALRDAVVAVKAGDEPVVIVAPGTAENVLNALRQR